MQTLTVNFLIKDSPMAVSILDTGMRFISHSRIWLKEFGITDTDIIGKTYYEVLPATPNELREIHQHCLKGGASVSKGQKFVHPNGSVQWLRWKINSWKNDDGAIGGLITIVEDITEDKRKEELLSKALNVARIGGWEFDLISNQLSWTAITKEIHEVSPDYVPSLEEGINFYRAGEHRDAISELVGEALRSGKPWDTELQIVTGKGKELWVRAKGEAEMVDNRCVRLFGTLQDIDEKKKTALEYQKVSERLAIATQAADIGIWDYDVTQNKLIWDDFMYKIYGIRKADFSGEVEAWEASVHPDDKERCQKEVERALAGEKEFKSEFRVIWPNQEVRFIKAESTVRRDAHGNPLRMIGVNWDITAEKNAEKKLKNLVEITSAQNESLLNFAHIVSHNLRSHSSNLSMLSGFLSKESRATEKASLVKLLGDASESLNETVSHLNEVVQVKTSAQEKLKCVMLYDSIKQVEKNLSVLIKEKGVKRTIKVHKDITINAIPAYLDSVLLNLFTNSIKYSAPERAPIIKIEAREKRDQVVVTFTDNGLGIDLEKYGKKLFGMYKTFHRHKDARGIGLFITKNQVEAMNGKIEVASTVNQGTTFTLYFEKAQILTAP